MPDIPLYGCTPEPLINYLKALGILRLVAEQKDKNAKGRWKDGIFWLRSELDREGLVRFFLEKYKPTPILAPWNGGSGFYQKWDCKNKKFKERKVTNVLERISNSNLDRLKKYRETIELIKQALAGIASCTDLNIILNGKTKKEKEKILNELLIFQSDRKTFSINKSKKDELLFSLRSKILTDESLSWMDSAIALTSDKKKNRHEFPLLGTGGNVGNSDFAAMFMLCIQHVTEQEYDNKMIHSLLESSILSSPTSNILNIPIGQFDPGKAGGMNQTQGFEGENFANPWDFIFMCEGSLLTAGSITRRTETGDVGVSFPFTVKNSPVGYGSSGEEINRGETWLPVWDNHVGPNEIKALFCEGRVRIGKKEVKTGLDFSRSIAMLGVDRGINYFIRYGFQERFGQNYLAVPLGRFQVKARLNVDLIKEIDKWLDSFRRATSDKNAPPRFKSALRRIETAIFQYCQFGENHRFQEILCALGQAEKELAITEGKVGTSQPVSPISKISPDWIKASNDNSVEFEIALALASIWDRERKIGPIRANLEPVTWKGHSEWKGYVSWCKKCKSVSWNNANLKDNMTAVLERRILEANRSNCSTLPLSYFHGVSLEALSRFISGEVDDDRIAELLWGMMLIDHWKKYPEIPHTRYESLPIPRAFALLKMLFLPYDLEKNGKSIHIRTEERILPLLRSNRPGEACAIAARRLRSSGILSMSHSRNSNRDHEWAEAIEGLDTRRIAAALLIPAHHDTIDRLMKLVARPEKVLPEIEVKEIERRD